MCHGRSCRRKSCATGNARAPDGLGNEIDGVSQQADLIAAGDAGGNVAQAGQVLAENHGADEAVVALGVADVHLVLQHPARAGHALGEAEEHLQARSCRQLVGCSCCSCMALLSRCGCG